jgi:hypothetical protein
MEDLRVLSSSVQELPCDALDFCPQPGERF